MPAVRVTVVPGSRLGLALKQPGEANVRPAPAWVASPIDPSTLPGLTGWWDFSTLGLADGAAIASLPDGSTNGRTATAAGSAQPTFKTGIINGLGVGRFDGVDDMLATASFSLAQPFTVLAVITGGGAGPLRYFSSADLAARAGWSTTDANNFAGSTLQVGYGTTGAPKIVTSLFNGLSSLIRVDQAQVVAGDVGAGTIATGVTIGSTGAFQFWNGDIGEIILVAGVLSPDVAAGVEAYLYDKWFVPAPSLTGSDTLGTIDVAARSLLLDHAASDSLGTTDVASRLASGPRTGADTLGTADTATRAATTRARTTADSLSTTDAATRAASFPRSSSDTLATTDTATRAPATRARSSTDNLATSDTATRAALLRARASSDTLGTTDQATGPVVGQDTLGTTDAATRAALQRIRTGADTLATNDTTVRTFTRARFTTDTLGTSDAGARGGRLLLRLAVDSLGTTDSVSSSITGVPDVPTTLALGARTTVLFLDSRQTVALVDSRNTTLATDTRQTNATLGTRQTTSVLGARSTNLPLDPRTTAVTIDG